MTGLIMTSPLPNNSTVNSYGHIFDLANCITLCGLCCGLMAVAVANQSLELAMLCLMAAGLADMLDGWVARQTTRSPWQSNIGAELDTLVDLCCFGWVPLIILALRVFQHPISYVVMVFYLVCAILRLAIFNCVGLQIVGDRSYFIGLPVTSISLILPMGLLVARLMPTVFNQEIWMLGVIGVFALLMISPLYFPKLDRNGLVIITMLFVILATIYIFLS